MMAEYRTELHVTMVQSAGWFSRAHWKLREDFVYNSDLIGLITVPAGTLTDFASVPRLPFVFLFAGNRVYRPAVLHDHLYHSADAWPRLTCDRVFFEAMTVSRTPGRRSLYYAVRMFGGLAYWRHANANQAAHR